MIPTMMVQFFDSFVEYIDQTHNAFRTIIEFIGIFHFLRPTVSESRLKEGQKQR